MKRNATDALLSLVQGKNQSVLSYWTKFAEYLYRSDISPDSARPIFERGLNFEIRDRLVDKDLPDDLDSYVQCVVDLDNRLFRLKRDRQNTGGFGNRRINAGHNRQEFRFETHKSVPVAQNGPTPMDLGNLDYEEEVLVNGVTLSNSRERLEEIRKMSSEDRRRICEQERRCHYCKIVVGSPPSHLAFNCPAKNKRNGAYLFSNSEVNPREKVCKVQASAETEELEMSLNVVSEAAEEIEGSRLLKLLGELRVGNISATVEVMFDSGAMGMCYMDREFAKNLGLKLKKIGRVIT